LYKNYVLAGAEEHGLPLDTGAEHIEAIEGASRQAHEPPKETVSIG
jgi:hypothetical protein